MASVPRIESLQIKSGMLTTILQQFVYEIVEFQHVTLSKNPDAVKGTSIIHPSNTLQFIKGTENLFALNSGALQAAKDQSYPFSE